LGSIVIFISQKSLVLHIRVLWNLADTKEVPGTPSATVLQLFSARFLTEESLYDTQSGPELIPLSLIKIRSGIPFNTTGQSATQIQQIEEHSHVHAELLGDIQLDKLVSRPSPDTLFPLQLSMPYHHS
jgi:hypothetical protein